MKKVLFATTALVASTSFAMADVDLSGSAEMGIFGGDGVEDQFHTDIDVTFSMSGTTDTGLTFGASIDLDESDTDRTISGVPVNNQNGTVEDIEVGGSPAFDNSTQGGETIFISGSFGTLTMGDTDGAFDWALSEAIIGSAINDDHEHAGYNGNSGLDGTYDGQIARYDYSFGDFAFAASAEMNDEAGNNDDDVFGLGAKYSGEFGAMNLGFGLGYQTRNASDIVGVSVTAGMDNGIKAILNYSDLDGVKGNDTHTGIAVGYSAGAITVAANYGVFDRVDGTENKGYGLVANYDLGGGAQVQAGYGNSDRNGVDSDRYSLGVAMSF